MENNESKLLGMERCVILQAIAENYLIRTTGKHFDEAYPEVQEEYGVLLEQHIRLLKAYLNEEYAERNLNLNECIRRTGETAILDDKLTDYEVKALIRNAYLVLSTYVMVEERKKKLWKKEA